MVAVIVVFGPIISYDFVVWDDNLHVYENPRFQPVTWQNVLAFWQAPYANLYIPLTYTTWSALVWCTRALWPEPLSAGLFHSLNLLLHLGSMLVVYRLGLSFPCRQGTAEGQLVGAAIGALLFGLHPLQVEAVAWVSGLKDTLCGWWALVAIWQYVQYAQAAIPQRRRVHYGLASAAFGLALLAKPAAIAVPVMVGVLDIFTLRKSWRHALRSLGMWLGAAGFWGLWTHSQQTEAISGGIVALWIRPLIMADTILFYLGKLFWPVQLVPDYGRTPQMVLAQEGAYGSLLVVLVLCGILWWWRRQLWEGGVAFLVMVAGLLPVLGAIPFIFQDYSTVADRYIYLALLGPALGLGWLIQRGGQQRLVQGGSFLVVGLLGWCSVAQVPVWSTTETLFTHTLSGNPRSALAYNNLGLVVAGQGELKEATLYFQTAVQLKPHLPEAHYNLGKAFILQGQHNAAIAEFTTALELRPHWAEAYNNLGVALVAQGRASEAIPHYVQALLLKPDWAQAQANLRRALVSQRDRTTQEQHSHDTP
jgi:hypothetical protein